MPDSVESFCDLLIESRLLSEEEVHALSERWQRESDEPEDLQLFTQWLKAGNYLTEYQASLLLQGQADHFFLGPYKLLDRIGSGRLATVFKATHEQGQLVAIKVLPPSKAKDPRLLARFSREAVVARRFRHPNVVRMFQASQTHGLHYLVMEYLDGETLQDVLERRGRLPTLEAVRLVYQALLGLQHLHEQGIVHRNLEPANLMLVPRPAPGQPDTTLECTLKILDISLSRALTEETGQSAFHSSTEEKIKLGNPAYQAPEQASPAQPVDVRADIYGAGCILYHSALAGQPPFLDANPLRMTMRHRTEPLVPIRKLNPEVPGELERLLGRMLAKDPSLRFKSAEQAAEALQGFLVSPGETTRDSGTTPESSPPNLRETKGREPANFPYFEVAPLPEGSELGRFVLPEKVPDRPKEIRPTPVLVEPVQPLVQPVIDVELVALPSPAPPSAAKRREYLFLILGAAGFLLAQVFGWLLGRIFKHHPDQAHSPDQEENPDVSNPP